MVGLMLFADAQQADASCGDYLLVNGVPVSHQQMTAPGGIQVDGFSISEGPLQHKCSGPNCSSSPTAPSPVTTTVHSTKRVDLPAAVGVKLIARLEFMLTAHAFERFVADSECRDIFRPPQALSA